MNTNANIENFSKNHSGRFSEAPLAQEHFQFSLIINNSEEFLLLINSDFKIIVCNQIVQRLVKERLQFDIKAGDDFFLLVTPDQKDYVKNFCERAFDGEKVEFEYEVKIEEDKILCFHTVYKPSFDNKGEVIAVVVISKDITETKRAYKELLESEKRWRFALEGSNQGVWDWNILTSEVYFSPSWHRMLGYSRNETPSTLAEARTLIHPDDRERMEHHIQEHFKSQAGFYEAELRVKTKEGYYKWILSKGMIVDRLEDNTPARMIGLHSDITERKKVEEDYKLLFYDNPMPMWTFDPKTHKFLDVNKATIKNYGYSKEEFLKMTLFDIRPEEDIEKLRNFIDVVNDEKLPKKKLWRHKRKNGEIIYVNITVQTFDDEAKKHRLVIAEDITQQIMAEGKLKASEKKYRTLFKANPLPSFIYEVETLRILEVNDAAVRDFGFSSKEFLQMTLLDIHPTEQRKNLLFIIEKNKTRTSFKIANWKLLNKKGDELVCDVSASSLEYNGAHAQRIILNDITAKVKAQEELLQSNERFQFVTRATSDITWDWNFKTNQLFLSDNYQKILGWELPPDNLIDPEKGMGKCHPEDMERTMASLNAAIANPEISIWEDEFRYQRADGSYAYIADRGFVSRDENGVAVRMVGVLQDISERKYQEELQLLELKVFEVSAVPDIHFHVVLKTLINAYENLHPAISGSICILGFGGEVEMVAPGLTEDDARQLRYFIEKQKGELPDKVDNQKNIIISSFESNDWKYGTDAASFCNWKTSWSIPVYQHSGALLAFFTVFLDQARKPNELEQNTLARIRNLLRILMVNHLSVEQIRISNQRYDNMLRATHDLVWDWNLETGNFYRNKEGLRKVYGIYDEKSIENVYSWMERIHPADHVKVQGVINDILHATNEDTFDVEYRVKKDDGDYAFIYDRGVIVRNMEGKPLRMIGAAQNVTERRKLEQELLQQELNKQKFISKATIDTQEQERREIGKELHDNVNQVLTTTKLYLDLSLTSPELKDELIKKSSKNIIYVINEIRQLSRSLMDPSIGDLGLVDSINDLVENINITRKLYVSLSAASDLEKYLDESQKLMVFRVIQEALNNTIKYAQATAVQISIKVKGGNLELLIADDGKGFELDTIKKGAGLKNIQNRVYLTGGNLTINSAPEKGCKISIKFPIKQST